MILECEILLSIVNLFLFRTKEDKRKVKLNFKVKYLMMSDLILIEYLIVFKCITTN